MTLHTKDRITCVFVIISRVRTYFFHKLVYSITNRTVIYVIHPLLGDNITVAMLYCIIIKTLIRGRKSQIIAYRLQFVKFETFVR